MQTATDDGIRRFILDRPPRNLLTPAAMDELRDGLLRAGDDDSVRGIVIDHAGDVFCGGLDVGDLRASGDAAGYATSAVELLRVFPRSPKPIVAAVRGDALALGFSLVCCADVAVTVPDARLGTFEAGVGMWPMIAQVPAARLLAPRHALENIITGEPFTADRACAIGVVNEVVAPADVDAAIAAWLPRVTAGAGALPAGRRAFYRFLDLDYDTALSESRDEFVRLFTA